MARAAAFVLAANNGSARFLILSPIAGPDPSAVADPGRLASETLAAGHGKVRRQNFATSRSTHVELFAKLPSDYHGRKMKAVRLLAYETNRRLCSTAVARRKIGLCCRSARVDQSTQG